MKRNSLSKFLFVLFLIVIVAIIAFAIYEGKIPHKHLEGEWETTVAPTCTLEGTSVKKCRLCDEEMSNTAIPALGHTAGEWYITVAPTCTSVGERKASCTICSEVISTEEVAMANHISNGWEISIAASCTSDGLRKKTCINCMQELDSEVIPKHPNTVHQSKIPATCVSTGLSSGSYCPDCNTIFQKQTELPLVGHTWVTDAAVPATCMREGLTRGVHCSVCRLVQTKQEVIPKTEHNIVDVSASSPTCTTTGSTAGTQCSMCKTYMIEPQTVPALGHEFDYDIGGCSRCQYRLSASEISTVTIREENPYSWDSGNIMFSFEFNDEFQNAIIRNPDSELIVTISFYATHNEGWSLKDTYLTNLKTGGEKFTIIDGKAALDKNKYIKFEKQFTINTKLLQQGKMYLVVDTPLILVASTYSIKNLTLRAVFADAVNK
ncbi:MAG: hypothetical protein J6D23_02280 [Clostridia bacterium]|nr:hypothetical protein [Clostridia bacterium]